MENDGGSGIDRSPVGAQLAEDCEPSTVDCADGKLRTANRES
jgi:hypothetical protein